MDRLDALRVFVRVIESGSFAAAAREGGLGQPAVSKQVASLERYFGAQLIRRTSRSMTLTEVGKSVYESALRIVDDFTDLKSSVMQGQISPSGLIRVTVAPVFGRMYIVPNLSSFFLKYPLVSIDLSATERIVNLVEEGFDLSIKHGDLLDSSMTSRYLASSPIVVVATPSYLEKHGQPKVLEDIERHSCVAYAPQYKPQAWRFDGVGGPDLRNPSGNFQSGDSEQLRAAVLSGMGLAQVPAWLFAEELKSGKVVSVLEEYAPAPLPIYIVHPSGRRMPAKTKEFVDFIFEVIAKEGGPAFIKIGSLDTGRGN